MEKSDEKNEFEKRQNLKKAEKSKQAEAQLLGLADTLYNQFQQGIVPHISLPSRTKGNIEYSTKDDVWVYGDQETTRSVKTVRGAKTLLKTVHLTELLIKEHLNHAETLIENLEQHAVRVIAKAMTRFCVILDCHVAGGTNLRAGFPISPHGSIRFSTRAHLENR